MSTNDAIVFLALIGVVCFLVGGMMTTWPWQWPNRPPKTAVKIILGVGIVHVLPALWALWTKAILG